MLVQCAHSDWKFGFLNHTLVKWIVSLRKKQSKNSGNYQQKVFLEIIQLPFRSVRVLPVLTKNIS